MRKTCTVCGLEFEAKRAARKTCGERCKKRAQRQPKPAEVVPLTPEQPSESGPAVGGLVAATQRQLEAADRLDTAGGQAALALARRIEHGGAETGSAMASLVREFRATLADAVKNAHVQEDPLDELRLRREHKLSG